MVDNNSLKETTCSRGCPMEDLADGGYRPEWLPGEAVLHLTCQHELLEDGGSSEMVTLLCPSCERRFLTNHGNPHKCQCGHSMVFYGNTLCVWPSSVFPTEAVPFKHFHRQPQPPLRSNGPSLSTASDPILSAFMCAIVATAVFSFLGLVTGAWFFLALTLWGGVVSTGLLISSMTRNARAGQDVAQDACEAQKAQKVQNESVIIGR